MHFAQCNRCSFESRGTLLAVAVPARNHERETSGHYVTIWDTPTSQIPRSLWAKSSTALVKQYPTTAEIGTEDAARLWELRAAEWVAAVLKWASRPAGSLGRDETLTDSFEAMQSARETAAWHRSLIVVRERYPWIYARLESPMS